MASVSFWFHEANDESELTKLQHSEANVGSWETL